MHFTTRYQLDRLLIKKEESIKPNSLYLSGLFVDWFNSKDLKKAIKESLNKGADGICIFSSEYLNDDHLKTISTFKS